MEIELGGCYPSVPDETRAGCGRAQSWSDGDSSEWMAWLIARIP